MSAISTKFWPSTYGCGRNMKPIECMEGTSFDEDELYIDFTLGDAKGQTGVYIDQEISGRFPEIRRDFREISGKCSGKLQEISGKACKNLQTYKKQ